MTNDDRLANRLIITSAGMVPIAIVSTLLFGSSLFVGGLMFGLSIALVVGAVTSSKR